MARSSICLGCGEPTTNVGGRCARCAGGLRQTRGGHRYADPRYRRMRDRVVGEHRRRFGSVCPRCGGRESPRDPGSRLSYNHDVTMSTPGADILGPGSVMCVSCNSRQLHVDRPDLSRGRRRQGGR